MDGAANTGLALVRAGVDELLNGGLSGLSGLEFVALLEGLETERHRLDAVDVQVVAEVDQRQVAGDYGRTSTADLLAHALRVTPREARARVERARDLGPRSALSGEVLPPLLPATSEALTAGLVSGGHVEVIAGAMRRVDDLPDAMVVAPVAEAFLVDAARHEDPHALRRTARLLLDRLDPDGVEPREDAAHRRRGFTLCPSGDGSARVSGRWTAQAIAVWQAILDSLAAPDPAADGTPDDRTPAQRRHDGMVEAGLRLLRAGTLPATGGTPVTVLVRTTAEDLATPGGTVQTAHGDRTTLAGVNGCGTGCGADAAFIDVTVDPVGAVLNLGRTRRCGTVAQRRVLAVRDGGCCFPGCTRPVAWTEVHHVHGWADGGVTDIDNLCLLCAHHHREVDRTDWTLIMTDGIPEWLPPPWLDPLRRPVRNRAHHLPDITFDLTGLDPGLDRSG